MMEPRRILARTWVPFLGVICVGLFIFIIRKTHSILGIFDLIAACLLGFILNKIANNIEECGYIYQIHPNRSGRPRKFHKKLISLKHHQKAARILFELAESDRFAGKGFDRPLDLIVGVNPGGLETAVVMNRMLRKRLGIINTVRQQDRTIKISDALLPTESPKGILVVDAKWKKGDSINVVHQKLRAQYPQAAIRYAIVLGYNKDRVCKSINEVEIDLMNKKEKVTIYVANYTDIDPTPVDPIVEEARR